MKNYTIWVNILARQPEIEPPGLIDELDPHALGYHDSAASVDRLFSAIADEFPETDGQAGRFAIEISAELDDGDGRYHETHNLVVGDFQTAQDAANAATALGDKYYHDHTAATPLISRYFVSEGENFDFKGPYDSEDDGIADCPDVEYVRIIEVRAPEGVAVEVDYWEQDLDY